MITFCFLAAQGGCEPQLTSHAAGNDKAFLFEMDTVQPYAENYRKYTEQAQQQLRQDARPELKQYLELLDFTGKKVFALMTHEGSGLGQG